MEKETKEVNKTRVEKGSFHSHEDSPLRSELLLRCRDCGSTETTLSFVQRANRR